jgi:hypothetical protein
MAWKSIGSKGSTGVECPLKEKERTVKKSQRNAFRTSSRTKFPIVLAEWPRNGDEVVMLQLVEFRGQKRLDLRVWRRDESGDPRASRKGVPIPLERLSLIRNGLRKAEKIGAKLGIID